MDNQEQTPAKGSIILQYHIWRPPVVDTDFQELITMSKHSEKPPCFENLGNLSEAWVLNSVDTHL